MLNRRETTENTGRERWPNGLYKLNEHRLPKADELADLLSLHPNAEWLSCTLVTNETDPLAWLEHLAGEPELSYWEKPDEELAIATAGAAACLKATGPERFSEIKRQGKELQRKRLVISSIHHTLADPLLTGGYSFNNHNVCESWAGFGAARFVLPRRTFLRSGRLHLLTLNLCIRQLEPETIADRLREESEQFRKACREVNQSSFKETDNRSDGALRLTPDRTQDEWKRQVTLSRGKIAEGAFEKIVLSRQLEAELPNPIHVPRLLYHFRNRFPACHNFLFRAGGRTTFAGASPERLISLSRSMIRTEGLAGSIGRGRSAVEDLALGRYLMESGKERSEHEFVVRDIRDNLAPIARRIDHPDVPRLKKLNNVQHLYTPITAEVDRDMTIHQLLETLHPTPAVGGFPAADAVPHINRIEVSDRGWYAGPVGWFNLSGNGEFAVAIRSTLVRGRRARLFAGSGIVRDSDPQREWKETELKFNTVLDALRQAAGPDHE